MALTNERLRPALRGWKRVTVSLRPIIPLSLRPALRGWKLLCCNEPTPCYDKSPTRLEGMETGDTLLWCRFALRSPTRLEGMETFASSSPLLAFSIVSDPP